VENKMKLLISRMVGLAKSEGLGVISVMLDALLTGCPADKQSRLFFVVLVH
jgi:hypothetical protein